MKTFIRGLKRRGDDVAPLLLALVLFAGTVAAGYEGGAPAWLTWPFAAVWPVIWAFGVWDQGKEIGK